MRTPAPRSIVTAHHPSARDDPLQRYAKQRDFKRTLEPKGTRAKLFRAALPARRPR